MAFQGSSSVLPSALHKEVGVYGWGEDARKLTIGYEVYPGAPTNIKMHIRYHFPCKNRVTGEMSNEWRYTNSGVTLNLYEFSGLYENLEKIETLIGLFQEQERKCIGEPGYTLSVEGNPLERHVSVMHSRDFLDPVTMVVFHSIIKKGSQESAIRYEKRQLDLTIDRWHACLPYFEEFYLTLQNLVAQRKMLASGEKNRNMGSQRERLVPRSLIGEFEEGGSAFPSNPLLSSVNKTSLTPKTTIGSECNPITDAASNANDEDVQIMDPEPSLATPPSQKSKGKKRSAAAAIGVPPEEKTPKAKRGKKVFEMDMSDVSSP